MAFRGDFTSFPLPELLQWLDSSRKTGSLSLIWEGGERKLILKDGQVVAAAHQGLWEWLARLLSFAGLVTVDVAMAALRGLDTAEPPVQAFRAHEIDPADPMGLAREELYGPVVDLTSGAHGQFHWTEDVEHAGEEWVPLELSLRALVFEALRWLDEAAEVERALPNDTVMVRAIGKATADQPLLYRVMLILAEKGQSLGQLRLSMGLSRSAATRRIYDLLKLKLVEVEGAGTVAEDPITRMLEKGLALVKEQQFEAANLVFSSLLRSDPADHRVREFARMVEAEYTAALYRELPPLSVFAPISDPEQLKGLRPEDRQVASLVNGSWDVSTITLASPARELETLKSLHRLMRKGLLRPAG